LHLLQPEVWPIIFKHNVTNHDLHLFTITPLFKNSLDCQYNNFGCFLNAQLSFLIFYLTVTVVMRPTGNKSAAFQVDCNRPFAFFLVYKRQVALFGGRLTRPSA
jgi:hypothetical protein